jgi:ankyrin repeat protein
MRLLLEHGADPAMGQKNHTSALILAAGLGRGLGTFADEYSTEAQQLQAVKVLLDRHVDINAANDAGQTALHVAALSMDSVVELLVMNGAKLDATDKQPNTTGYGFGWGAAPAGPCVAAPPPQHSRPVR